MSLKLALFARGMGAATGTKHSYVDLICFDKDELEKAVSKFSKELDIKIEICEFKR